jgi:hypothetical protein
MLSPDSLGCSTYSPPTPISHLLIELITTLFMYIPHISMEWRPHLRLLLHSRFNNRDFDLDVLCWALIDVWPLAVSEDALALFAVIDLGIH